MKLALMLAVFAAFWFLPVDDERFLGAVYASLALARWYAQEHVLLCLVPAFFIAGAISVFVSQGAVMRYLGPAAKKALAYPVAATSGVILAVCSCTVLPLFASIHKRGAGLGPATAFLYSGPAINVLAIILTARVLGAELGIARAVGAIVFAVVLGLAMQFIFRKEEAARQAAGPVVMPDVGDGRALWQDGLYFAAMVGILVFANLGGPADAGAGIWAALHSVRWIVTGVLALGLAAMITSWFDRGELAVWVDASWTFAKQIMPLLLGGVLVAGFRARGARQRGTRHHPERVGRAGGRRKLAGCQLHRIVRGRVHVLRHPHRGTDPRGAHPIRHGQGAGVGAVAGRTGVVAPQPARHPQRARQPEDARVPGLGGGALHRRRDGLRDALLIHRGHHVHPPGAADGGAIEGGKR